MKSRAPCFTFDALPVHEAGRNDGDPCFHAAYQFGFGQLGAWFDEVFDVAATVYRCRFAGKTIGVLAVDDEREQTIRIVYVDEAWRRRGVASRLLAYARSRRRYFGIPSRVSCVEPG